MLYMISFPDETSADMIGLYSLASYPRLNMGGESLGTKASPVRVVRTHVDVDEVLDT